MLAETTEGGLALPTPVPTAAPEGEEEYSWSQAATGQAPSCTHLSSVSTPTQAPISRSAGSEKSRLHSREVRRQRASADLSEPEGRNLPEVAGVLALALCKVFTQGSGSCAEKPTCGATSDRAALGSCLRLQ